MKEKIINYVCLMIGKAYTDIDLSTVRNILTLALKDCEITKRSTDVTVYDGTDHANTLLKAERMNYHDKTY